MHPILQGLETERISSFVWCPLGWRTGQVRVETERKQEETELGRWRAWLERNTVSDNLIEVEVYMAQKSTSIVIWAAEGNLIGQWSHIPYLAVFLLKPSQTLSHEDKEIFQSHSQLNYCGRHIPSPISNFVVAAVTLRSGAFSGLNWRGIRANNKNASGGGGATLLATESQTKQRISKAEMVPRGCFGGEGKKEIDAESRAPWQQTSNQTQQQRLWSAGTPPRLADICYTC